MYKVGITGGIGSGKSTVCGYLERMFAIPVYYADTHAKRLMVENENVAAEIRSVFGEKAYAGGALNRKYISSVVFRDPVMLDKLNKAVHRAVMEDFRRWALIQNSPYVVCEAAILIESGWNAEMDLVVVVEASLEERVRRVVIRDGVSPEMVMERISAQTDDVERRRHADIIVVTDDSNTMENRVSALHNRIMTFVASRD